MAFWMQSVRSRVCSMVQRATIGGARRPGQQRQIEGRFRVSDRRGGGFGQMGRGGRHLAAGHAVVQVVDADHGQVHVAPGRMDEVIAADGEQIAVAAEDHDVQLGIAQLQPGGKGNGPAMGGVKRVELDIPGGPARTADARYHAGFLQIDAAGLHGRQAGGKGGADAASRAPDMGNAIRADQIVQRMSEAQERRLPVKWRVIRKPPLVLR